MSRELTGIKAKLHHKKRYAEKVQMKKTYVEELCGPCLLNVFHFFFK